MLYFSNSTILVAVPKCSMRPVVPGTIPLNQLWSSLQCGRIAEMPYLSEGEKLSDGVLAFNKTAAEWSAREGAYAFMHATKPLTVAFGLNDSPVGLCAWIVEKFNGWSDNSGNIENAFTKDELLANVTLYWVTQTIHSSMRIYNENRKKPMVFAKGESVNVPVGFAKFPKGTAHSTQILY